MTSYNNDTLELIPGETPREKYEWVKQAIEKINGIEKMCDDAYDKGFKDGQPNIINLTPHD